MVTLILMIARSFMIPAEIFYKKQKKVPDCMYSPFSTITYTLTFPPTSLEQFLRAIGGAVSQAVVFILPKMKFNSQLTLCIFLKSAKYIT